MAEKKKPSYETPTVLPLGELARGHGAPCRPGSAASNKCETGGAVPPPSCSKGHKAGLSCNKGSGVAR